MDDIKVKVIEWRLCMLLQKSIRFNDLTTLQLLADGGFGVIYRAHHKNWGTVVYKQLKSEIIKDGSRFIGFIFFCFHMLICNLHRL